MTSISREEALITRLRNAEPCGENGCRVRDADSGCICTEAANAIGSLLARLSKVENALRPFAEPHAMGDNYVQFAPRLIEDARAALAEKP